MNCCSDRKEEKWNPANFFHRGVSLKILKDVLKKYEKIKDKECLIRKDNGEFRNASNGERLVEMIVKKACESDQCSYVEHLGKDMRNWEELGICNVFISHAWKYDFEDLTSALERFQMAYKNEKIYYFLDYLAVNQVRPKDDLDNLKLMVTSCKSLVLVLLPWYDPIPLTRA